MTEKNRVKILGVPVDMVDRGQAMQIFEESFPQSGVTMVVTPNSEIVQRASKEGELRELISSADLIIPDGVGLVYASKIIGCPLSERVTGDGRVYYIFIIIADIFIHAPAAASFRI